MKRETFTIPAPKARHGVPAALAARYLTRTVRPKKGRGAYTRKGRKA
jgi:hypothetical protein